MDGDDAKKDTDYFPGEEEIVKISSDSEASAVETYHVGATSSSLYGHPKEDRGQSSERIQKSQVVNLSRLRFICLVVVIFECPSGSP